jgi:diguanylate cyclase (GGDEF)-like protein
MNELLPQPENDYFGGDEDFVSADSQYSPLDYKTELGVHIVADRSGLPKDQVELVSAMARAAIAPYRQSIDTLEQHNSELAEIVSKDGLTGILNRNSFFASVSESVASKNRWEDKLTTNFLVLLDGDGFSAYNEQLGHPGGDAILQQMALTLKEYTRAADKIGRLGGDEFAVLVTGISRTDLPDVIAHIVDGISKIRVEGMDESQTLTASIGITELPQGSDRADVDGAYRNADLALYNSKHMGRDRATLITPRKQDIFEAL